MEGRGATIAFRCLAELRAAKFSYRICRAEGERNRRVPPDLSLRGVGQLPPRRTERRILPAGISEGRYRPAAQNFLTFAHY